MEIHETRSDTPAENRKPWHMPQLEALGGIEKETAQNTGVADDGLGGDS